MFHFKRIKELERRQQLTIYIVFVLTILLILSVSAVASYRYFANKQQSTTELDNSLNLDQAIDLNLNSVAEEDQKTLNVLLAGYGGAGHEGGYLSDIIQIAHFDFEKKQLSFISIPRDLYLVDTNQQGYKVNALMAAGMSKNGGIEGGLELMRTSLSQIVGLPIKYYIGIDFVGFQRTIGYEFNNIEVNVSQTLEDSWYPIEGAQLDPCGYSNEEIAELTATYSGFELESKFECRYEHLLFEQGTVSMDGHDALAYVRSRHSSSDYDRSRRQVEVLTAIRDKLFKLEALKNIPKFYEALSQHVSTNLDLASTQYLAPLLVDANQFTIKEINLSPDNVLQSGTSNAGAFILIPKAGNNNWTELKSFIKEQL